ncbi:FecCD family ABC transporter permease [Actinokineospora sp.]|uniref:FecCD family ABC transporter permease n=1 Tax=Actinokineospora sp. TaxID=1872133 RepID=UPI004037B413
MTGAVFQGRVVRTRGGLSARVDPRAVVVGLGTAVAILVVAVFAMTTGAVRLPVWDVVKALSGNGTPVTDVVVLRLRLPRVLTAILVGAALAVSGAVLQSLTRNVLGSPDFLGFTTGAATGALISIIVVGGGLADTAVGAFVGGVATAAVMYALVFRLGVQGFRFVLVGIGSSAMLLAFNYYLVTRASLYDALEAQAWLTGSLNLRGWDHVAAIGLTTAVLVPLAVGGARALSLLELGDDAARALGVPVALTRFGFIAISVGLASVATAVTGPISFVALAAPPVARALTRSAGPGLLTAGLVGGLLLLSSDVLVQRAFPSSQLPVGIATGAVGGLYLAWLLPARRRIREDVAR